jgi:hypothetical protein
VLPGQNDQNAKLLHRAAAPQARPPGPHAAIWSLAAPGREGALQRARAARSQRGAAARHRARADEVVVISAEEFRRLRGDLTGAALVAALQASPHRAIAIEPKRGRPPVRDVVLLSRMAPALPA